MEESKYEKFHIAPVEIMKYFDISKDAKFSLRTLLLLSIFTIAIFTFNFEPAISFLSIPKENYKWFAVFMLFIIVGQSVIAWCSYKLYKSHIDNFTTHLKNEIIRIKEALETSRKSDKLKDMGKSSHTKFMETKLSNHENIKKIFWNFL